MTAASANTTAARMSPSRRLSSSATTITGTARMRRTVSTFGRLIGNIAVLEYRAMKVRPLPPDHARPRRTCCPTRFGTTGVARDRPLSKPAAMADVESVLPRSTGPRIRARRCARRERRRAARHRDRLSGRSLAAAAALVRARGVGRRCPGPAPPRAACARRARSTPFIRTSPTTSSTRSGRPGGRPAPEPRCSAHRVARRGPRRADPPHDERPREPPLLPPVRARADGERELPAACLHGRCCAPQLARPEPGSPSSPRSASP